MENSASRAAREWLRNVVDLLKKPADEGFCRPAARRLRAHADLQRAVKLNEAPREEDPENFDYLIALWRGAKVFADALLEEGEKASAKAIDLKSSARAATGAPKRHAGFVEEFTREVGVGPP